MKVLEAGIVFKWLYFGYILSIEPTFADGLNIHVEKNGVNSDSKFSA